MIYPGIQGENFATHSIHGESRPRLSRFRQLAALLHLMTYCYNYYMKDELMEKVTFPEKGRYILAVSGGVDSMSLLHMLSRHNQYELIVAHANHGLREGSDRDEQLVQAVARQFGLRVKTTQLHLEDTSEDAARRARYDFLYSVREEEDATRIITAHHLDDRIETMLLNKQRGAGWIGLAPLHETDSVKRPLLGITKREIVAYAKRHELFWREDPTNRDSSYTPRNRLRQQLDDARRRELYDELTTYDEQRRIREQYITNVMEKVATLSEGAVSVHPTRLLEYDTATARDALYMTLKTHVDMYMEIDFDAIKRLEHFYKTASPGKKLSLSRYVWAQMERDAMVVFVARTSTP